jgi:membrane protein implicated in regulation of membrane protease activity
VRLVHRTRLHRWALMVALVDLATQLLIVVLGFALLFSPDALRAGTSLGTSPTWHSLLFAIPLAMLAYTGLETVANLAEETRRPGRDLPRSVFSAIGLVVVLYVAIAAGSATRCRCSSGSPARSSCSPLRRPRSPASAGWRTRSASTDNCRGSSGCCGSGRW